MGAQDGKIAAVQPHDAFLPYFQATQQSPERDPGQGGAESGSDGGRTLVRHRIEIRAREDVRLGVAGS
jgi:hypothetical protein